MCSRSVLNGFNKSAGSCKFFTKKIIMHLHSCPENSEFVMEQLREHGYEPVVDPFQVQCTI